MNRRQFLSISCFSGLIIGNDFLKHVNAQPVTNHFLMSVTGKINPKTIKTVLAHEHIITDFIGAEKIEQPQYDQLEAYNQLLPHLLELKKQRVNLLIECTPAYIGRDVLLLKKLSQASGINIMTNTGYYSAVNFKYLPQHVYTESSDQLASRWLNEWENGIENTGIKPGFIKLGVDGGALKPVAKKLIIAAAQVHLKSGLKIAIHTGDPVAAIEEQQLLQEEGVAAEAMIWVHAQNDQSGETHIKLAQKGCWISLDGINEKEEAIRQYTQQIIQLRKEKLLHRILISHDDGFAVNNKDGEILLEPYQNGNRKPYATLFNQFKKSLINAGITEKEFSLITRENPMEAFGIKVCRA